jgi:hypothetical protein
MLHVLFSTSAQVLPPSAITLFLQAVHGPFVQAEKASWKFEQMIVGAAVGTPPVHSSALGKSQFDAHST